MRRFNGRGPWNEAAGMDFRPDCRKGYGYTPGYYERYPFSSPYRYDREHDLEMEKEFLEHRLANIHEEERFIKERLESLEELASKESSQSTKN